jgi:hypothetical protein
MPDETIDAGSIQEPLDHKLKHKSDCGKDCKGYAIDIELANHGMLHHVTLTVSPIYVILLAVVTALAAAILPLA